jgi:hypothetical protein
LRGKLIEHRALATRLDGGPTAAESFARRLPETYSPAKNAADTLRNILASDRHFDQVSAVTRLVSKSGGKPAFLTMRISDFVGVPDPESFQSAESEINCE